MKTIKFENIINDIYFDKNYASLYADECDQVLEFNFQQDDKIFRSILIAKPIVKIGNNEITDGFYDASSPYGYNGIATNSSEQTFLDKAFEAFIYFCAEKKVIATFFRFHPFFDTNVFTSSLDFYTQECPVVYIDLLKDKEVRWSQYSAKTRNILRKCYKELIVEESNSLDTFLPLYYQTMQKNQASDFYYFEKEYFEELIEISEVKLFNVKRDDEIISSGFFFYSEDFVHYHLSANNTEFKKLNGNYMLLEHAADLGIRQKCKNFLLGGGRTSSIDDGLLRFKSKFSPSKLDFFIGGMICNDDLYKRYNEEWNTQFPERNDKYFLKYRLT